MKNTKFKTVINELAGEFTNEFNSTIKITPLPNGDVMYKEYLIKQTKTRHWAVYHITQKTLIHEFFLKTCALLAAKAYDNLQFGEYQRIKHLDNRYQSHYSDLIVYKHNIKSITDCDNRAIVLNKLEESQARAKEYQHQISVMFKVAFCINTL